MVILVRYLVTKSGIQSDGQVSNVVMAVAYNTKYNVKSSQVESSRVKIIPPSARTRLEPAGRPQGQLSSTPRQPKHMRFLVIMTMTINTPCTLVEN